jgi:hypothetical protein
MANKSMYLTGDKAFASYASQSDNDIDDPIVKSGQVARTIADRTFVGHDTNISVLSDYNRADYEYFRLSERVPQKQIEIIEMCMEAYQKVGLVRNVIDLMGDFGAQGIRLQHSVPVIQQFYTTWWNKVNGQERSERFLNQLYRCGQVIVKRSRGKISSFQERKFKKGMAKEEVKLQRLKTNQREIPLKYVFVSPLGVEIIGEELSQFVGQPTLGLKISTNLKTAVSKALIMRERVLMPHIKKMIDKIPKDVLEAIKRGDRLLPLDPDKTSVYYYKKDDWMLWANPMCFCILDDLIMLNKLKLADISALDGARSNIRLWTLGLIGDNPTNSILPTKAAINKVRSILANNVGGGTIDMVWGPELKFEESNSQVWRWLGSEKYETTIMAIYEGLGIPATLRGSQNGSTNTGSYVGLNTLVKRLQYGRDILLGFWNEELRYIHKAMGFSGKPPQIVFDFIALADEAAERQLLINLWDRNIISDDTILELFGRLPAVEKARVKSEENNRTHETMPYKASPFHNPDKEHEYRKILLQGGNVAPSEIGVDLNDRRDGEQSRLEQMETTQLKLKELDIKKQKESKPPGSSGRPPNVTETKKRKSKPADKPSTKAFVDIVWWASYAQGIIADTVNPALLASFGKNDIRSLSKDECKQCENIKLNILFNLSPFEKIAVERIVAIMSAECPIDNSDVSNINSLIEQFIQRLCIIH